MNTSFYCCVLWAYIRVLRLFKMSSSYYEWRLIIYGTIYELFYQTLCQRREVLWHVIQPWFVSHSVRKFLVRTFASMRFFWHLTAQIASSLLRGSGQNCTIPGVNCGIFDNNYKGSGYRWSGANRINQETFCLANNDALAAGFEQLSFYEKCTY